MFFQFVKFVDVFKPKVVVIENVRGIVTENNGYAKKEIYKIFEKRGYKVTHKILDASDYGVPQKRMRNFFVMSKDFIFDFEKIKIAVGKAIGSQDINEWLSTDGNYIGKDIYHGIY